MYGLKMAGPHICRNEPPVQLLVIAAKELQGFGNLQARNQIHDGAYHTYGVASIFQPGDALSSI
jgi:hypothetical protein